MVQGSSRDLGRVHTENLGTLFLAPSHLCFSSHFQVALVALGSIPWFLRPKRFYPWRLVAPLGLWLALRPNYKKTPKTKKKNQQKWKNHSISVPSLQRDYSVQIFEFLKHLLPSIGSLLSYQIPRFWTCIWDFQEVLSFLFVPTYHGLGA